MDVAMSLSKHDVIVLALPGWRWIHLHWFFLCRQIHLHGLNIAFRRISMLWLGFIAAPLKPELLWWRKQEKNVYVRCFLCQKMATSQLLTGVLLSGSLY